MFEKTLCKQMYMKAKLKKRKLLRVIDIAFAMYFIGKTMSPLTHTSYVLLSIPCSYLIYGTYKCYFKIKSYFITC